jgi:hypothetical protein
MRCSPRFVWMVAAVLLAGASGRGVPGSEPRSERAPNPAASVEGEPYRPQIEPADFVAVVDNPYHPLEPGTTRVYEGRSDGEREETVVTVTHRTKEVMRVTTTVVRDQVFVAGELAEDTFDWFAQDRHGNVPYGSFNDVLVTEDRTRWSRSCWRTSTTRPAWAWSWSS